MTDQEIFSNNLREILKAKNISQSQLADELGVTRAAVSKWCSGKGFPLVDKVEPLCSYLVVSRNQLFTDIEYETPSVGEVERRFRRLSRYQQQTMLAMMEHFEKMENKENEDNKEE